MAFMQRHGGGAFMLIRAVAIASAALALVGLVYGVLLVSASWGYGRGILLGLSCLGVVTVVCEIVYVDALTRLRWLYVGLTCAGTWLALGFALEFTWQAKLVAILIAGPMGAYLERGFASLDS